MTKLPTKEKKRQRPAIKDIGSELSRRLSKEIDLLKVRLGGDARPETADFDCASPMSRCRVLVDSDLCVVHLFTDRWTSGEVQTSF